MPRKSVNELIEQGYMITDANKKYAGEPWELTAELDNLFNPAFIESEFAPNALGALFNIFNNFISILVNPSLII